MRLKQDLAGLPQGKDAEEEAKRLIKEKAEKTRQDAKDLGETEQA